MRKAILVLPLLLLAAGCGALFIPTPSNPTLAPSAAPAATATPDTRGTATALAQGTATQAARNTQIAVGQTATMATRAAATTAAALEAQQTRAAVETAQVAATATAQQALLLQEVGHFGRGRLTGARQYHYQRSVLARWHPPRNRARGWHGAVVGRTATVISTIGRSIVLALDRQVDGEPAL